MVVLIGLAVLIGVGGGIAGWAFLHATAMLLSLTLTHQASWQMPQLADVHPGWTLIPIALAGGLVVSLIARREPQVRGHGIPEAMDAVLEHQSRLTTRTAVSKPVATSVAIGTGAPFGAEGPIIVTGGALGSLLGQAVKVSPSERKILLAAGAAAGMAAIFGTPIGGVVLALELLLFEFSTRGLVTLMVASVVADAIHNLLDGPGPFFPVPPIAHSTPVQLPFYALLGLVAGLLGALITFGVYRVEDGFAKLPIPRFFHPIIGALGFAVIGLLVPRSLGVGYDVIGDTLAGKLAIATLVAVFLAKLLAWWVAMGSGTSGSALAPLLLIGAAAGAILGSGLDHLLPGLGITSGGFALVAMVVTFGAAADAPFTAMVLGFELTGAYTLILPLMLAAVIGDVVVKRLLPESLMTEKLARRGLRVSTDTHVDLMETTLVRDVMEDAGGADRSDADSPVVLAPDETVLDALELMEGQAVDELPVVDHDEVVGVLTPDDILAVVDRQEQERPQPGLLHRIQRARRRRAAKRAPTPAPDESHGPGEPDTAAPTPAPDEPDAPVASGRR